MANKDYYELLGVSKSASQDEIKAAFRKKAMEHHPDRGGNAEKFKEINEAYQVLGNADGRKQYDQYGANFEQMRRQGYQGAGFDPREMGFDMGDLSDLFGGLGDMFGFGGGGRRTKREHRGRDLELEIAIPFEEAVHGATHDVELDKMNACEHCNSTGAEPGSGFKNCPTCGG